MFYFLEHQAVSQISACGQRAFSRLEIVKSNFHNSQPWRPQQKPMNIFRAGANGSQIEFVIPNLGVSEIHGSDGGSAIRELCVQIRNPEQAVAMLEITRNQT